MSKRNLALKIAILESGELGYVVAARANVNPSLLSQFVSGVRRPNRDQAERIATVLNRSVDELFPDNDGAMVP